jgi:hypothetical protein
MLTRTAIAQRSSPIIPSSPTTNLTTATAPTTHWALACRLELTVMRLGSHSWSRWDIREAGRINQDIGYAVGQIHRYAVHLVRGRHREFGGCLVQAVHGAAEPLESSDHAARHQYCTCGCNSARYSVRRAISRANCRRRPLRNSCACQTKHPLSSGVDLHVVSTVENRVDTCDSTRQTGATFKSSVHFVLLLQPMHLHSLAARHRVDQNLIARVQRCVGIAHGMANSRHVRLHVEEV